FRMTARRTVRIGFVVFAFLAAVLSAVAQLPELRDLDLSGWDCLSKLEGIAKTQDGKERNQQKNRTPIELTGVNTPSFDTTAFLARVADYDRQIEKKHRRELSPTQKEQVIALEKQIVSITGWLVLAYQGIPETTNCRSQDFLDWHLELSPESADHPAQVGDPTPVICEITPRTQALLYRGGVRIQKLAAFLRLPDNSFAPTGNKAHKIRVTGYLMWDDEHNKPDNDVGTSIGWFSKEGYHHPWRATGWEIHPVLKIEDLGTE
ncbi:MAG TPA: hypothetical protein VFP99_07325, partial [Chthoniobacterales bacterium]|nr:hypothetical protein [Chthoniobacterales bacterium]